MMNKSEVISSLMSATSVELLGTVQTARRDTGNSNSTACLALETYYIFESQLEELVAIMTQLDEDDPLVELCAHEFFSRMEHIERVIRDSGLLDRF
jgi:hypothetical protein